MKLFALGTKSSNPEEWEPWDEVELVIAETKGQAVKMCGYNEEYPAAEVDMTKAQKVMSAPAYVED